MRIYPVDQLPTVPKTGTPKVDPITKAFAGYLGTPSTPRAQINDRGPKGATYPVKPAKPISDVLAAINIRDPGTHGVRPGFAGASKDILQTASTAVPAHISSSNPARGSGGQDSISSTSLKPAGELDKYGKDLQLDSRISKKYSIAAPAKPGEDPGATAERFTKSGPVDDYKGRFSSFINAGGGIAGMPQLASNGINRVYDHYSKRIGA